MATLRQILGAIGAGATGRIGISNSVTVV